MSALLVHYFIYAISMIGLVLLMYALIDFVLDIFRKLLRSIYK